MKRLITALGSAAILAALFAIQVSTAIALTVIPASQAPTVTMESQGWWNKTGIQIPTSVGQHIHLQATVPMDWVPLDGPTTVPVKLTLHNNTGAVTFIRVQSVSPSGSIVEQVHVPVLLGPCTDCTLNINIPVDFSKWPTGRDEMRWTANIPKNSDGLRQYQSTGWQVCVRSCSSSYRSGNWIEARGWYDSGHGYQNARLTSSLSTVRSGGTITVKLAPGSGGLSTKFSGIYIDPDFHHGSTGIVVKTTNGSFSGSVTLPILSPGPHKLVMLASDGQDAGVLAIPFTV